MQRVNRWMFIALAGLLSACAEVPASEETKNEPAKLVQVKGAQLPSVILSEQAAKRIDIKTTKVLDEPLPGSKTPRKTIPYAAVLYDPKGAIWTYTNPKPLTFVRERIRIENIEGDLAILSEGPPADTAVVTVGVAELYGTEYEVGH